MFTVSLLNTGNSRLTNTNVLNNTPRVKVQTDNRPRIPIFNGDLKKVESPNVSFSSNQHGDMFVRSNVEANSPSKQKETGFISWLFDDFNLNDDDVPTYYNYW